MVDTKGLTGIREDARGFVGSKPPPIHDTTTKNNRTRIRFNIACGRNQEELGKFTTWRQCVAYSAVADILKALRVGDLVKVSGWVTTECVRDEYYKPVQDSEGRTKQREYLIVYKAEIIEREKTPHLQPSLMGAENN